MLHAWAVFQLFDLGVLGYGLDLRCWVAIAIIVSLTDNSRTSLAARGGNLAKIPPNQVIADFGRGSSVESESE